MLAQCKFQRRSSRRPMLFLEGKICTSKGRSCKGDCPSQDFRREILPAAQLYTLPESQTVNVKFKLPA
ncbi:hypothetical protein EJB05_29572 [Eragrostis curvula]|uniref:Uncharacterized protein n=1 Tax=Eragrostis curvula TaxID=38414 RepID=A0A5J9UUB2_9POAL|nr:hypothetical protein EJB05_29572 [Eragrostis curvula]